METTEQETVTCLGKTFESEEERREYFRKELRKKLPELKKMDGFPIGEDEDIIELSDPPYYTACPNPWLNEMIDQWETEKKQLLNQGKRNDNFSVDEPFASDVSEGKYNPFYMGHSYHTKVPHPAIMRYILHYTQPGDIIFDGFAGIGMTNVAAFKCQDPSKKVKPKIENEWKKLFDGKPNWGGRKSICGDISTISSFIAYNYSIQKEFVNDLKRAKEEIDEVYSELEWLYKTSHNGLKGSIEYIIWSDIQLCENCNGEINYWDQFVSNIDDNFNLKKETQCPHCKSNIRKSDLEPKKITKFDPQTGETVKQVEKRPVLINYSFDGSRVTKKPDKQDLEVIERAESYDIDTWIPMDKIPKGDKTQEALNNGITHTHHFFTKRNLIVFSKLWSKAQDNPVLKLLITSVIVKTGSILHNIGFKKGNINLAGALPNALYFPSIIAERNVFKLLENKISRFKKIKVPKEDSSAVFTSSSTDLSTIESNSIDYIFTDPPFGSNINYSELNIIWESWLKAKTNNEKEAIISRAQDKKGPDYQHLMQQCFDEYYRILKSDKWMTVEFSNTKAKIWNIIQTTLQRAGFVLSSVFSLDKKQGSYNAQTSPTAVDQDLIISCYKPSQKFNERFEKNGGEIGIWDFVDEHLEHLPIHLTKEDSTTSIVERSPKILYDRLVSFYVTRGVPVPIDSKDFQEELSNRYAERDGMYFTQEQVSKYDEKKAKTSDFVQLSLNVANESEGIEWLRAELQGKPQKYQDLHPKWMKAITAVRKGDILPELQTILEQNFIKKENGEWRVPNISEAKDREAMRNKVLMREFEEYVDQITGQGAKKLKEARAEALRAGFKNCWDNKDFETIVKVGEKIPENLLLEDDQLLMYYDIATDRV